MRRAEADALEGLGTSYLFQGQYNRAGQLLGESLAIYKQLGDKLGMAEVLNSLGLVAKHQGRLDEAEASHRQNHELFRQLGHLSRATAEQLLLELPNP